MYWSIFVTLPFLFGYVFLSLMFSNFFFFGIPVVNSKLFGIFENYTIKILFWGIFLFLICGRKTQAHVHVEYSWKNILKQSIHSSLRVKSIPNLLKLVCSLKLFEVKNKHRDSQAFALIYSISVFYVKMFCFLNKFSDMWIFNAAA